MTEVVLYRQNMCRISFSLLTHCEQFPIYEMDSGKMCIYIEPITAQQGPFCMHWQTGEVFQNTRLHAYWILSIQPMFL